MRYFLVFINSKQSSLRYLYFVPGSNELEAQLAAWKQFRQEFEARDEDWLISHLDIPTIDQGPQLLTCLSD